MGGLGSLLAWSPLLFLLLLIPCLIDASNQHVVLASKAMRHYMSAFLGHAQKRGKLLEKEENHDYSDSYVDTIDYEEVDGGLSDYYDIGTSEETMPNVNWTMLKPK